MPGQDPNLLRADPAKGKDTEARFNAHIANHPAAPPALAYGQTASSASQTASGTYSWTCPSGVTSVRVQCWGAGAGGGGGSGSMGGEGGGGGEYAEEPAYSVTPGTVYHYQVGNGATGGNTGQAGQYGGDSIFDTDGFGIGVYAQGGAAGSSFQGGQGGWYNYNTISFAGGNGGGTGSQSTGGCGGGGAAGPLGGGWVGATSSGSGGVPGGQGNNNNTGPNGGKGGDGGAAAANGNNGGAPGAAGGGCGAATSAATGSNQYRLSSSASYYGSDAAGGNANGLRGHGSMYQGGETASGGTYNGTQKSLGFIGGNPQGDLSGKTIDQVTIRLEWQHCWYNSGSYIILGYTGFTYAGASWNGSGITAVKTWKQAALDQGTGPRTTDLSGTGFGAALQSGAAQSISFGPGSAYNLNNYGYLYGAGGDNAQNPLITVNWHTGAVPVRAGAGADGQVAISWNVSGVLTQALQPAAGTDSGSNAFGPGFTGQVQAFQPGASPSVVEGWHPVATFGSGFAASGNGANGFWYRLLPDLSVEIAFDVKFTGTWASGAYFIPAGTLPAAYRPLRQFNLPVCAMYGTGATESFVYPNVMTDGGVKVWTASATAPPSGATFAGVYRYPITL